MLRSGHLTCNIITTHPNYPHTTNILPIGMIVNTDTCTTCRHRQPLSHQYPHTLLIASISFHGGYASKQAGRQAGRQGDVYLVTGISCTQIQIPKQCSRFLALPHTLQLELSIYLPRYHTSHFSACTHRPRRSQCSNNLRRDYSLDAGWECQPASQHTTILLLFHNQIQQKAQIKYERERDRPRESTKTWCAHLVPLYKLQIAWEHYLLAC